MAEDRGLSTTTHPLGGPLEPQAGLVAVDDGRTRVIAAVVLSPREEMQLAACVPDGQMGNHYLTRWMWLAATVREIHDDRPGSGRVSFPCSHEAALRIIARAGDENMRVLRSVSDLYFERVRGRALSTMH